MKNNLISSPNIQLDIVYTYVNTTDLKWINKVKTFKPTYGDDLNKQRFNYNGEIFFSLLTVQKFIPWIRKIFIVHDDQKFNIDFLNDEIKNKIIFVDHKDIINKKYLPIFNSMLIEMFLYKIKGLSEYFIYLNDDFFFGNYITQDFFFDNKLVFKQFLRDKKEPYTLDRLSNEPHLLRLINVHNLVKKIFKKDKFYISNHGTWNLNKYILKITFDLFKPLFIKMLKTQRFRTYNNDTYEYLTLSCIMAEELKIAKTIDNSENIFQVQRPLDQKLTSIIMKVKPKIFIINNLDKSQKKQWDYLRKKYIKMFENKEYNRLKKISKLRE